MVIGISIPDLVNSLLTPVNDTFLGIDCSKRSLGLAVLRDGQAAARCIRLHHGDITNVQELLSWLRVEPTRIALERPLDWDDIFDRDRVMPSKLEALRDWGDEVLEAVRQRWPRARIDWVKPMEVPKLLDLWTPPGSRLKFVAYDWVRLQHPELRLPVVTHRLKENGRDVIEVTEDGGLVGYDKSDAACLAHCARVRQGWSALASRML
jgi:hypothetical protein